MLQFDDSASCIMSDVDFFDTSNDNIQELITPVIPNRTVLAKCSINANNSETSETPRIRRCKSFDDRRIARKRSMSASEDPDSLTKHLDHSTEREHKRIKAALNSLSTDEDLIGDGSTKHNLPTIPSKHNDLKVITSETLVELINNKYDDEIRNYIVIDCRYPYEYDGGHIENTLNLHTKRMIDDFLLDESIRQKKPILIFHCEFSSERGPKLLRHLRCKDREMNLDNYPNLYFPELYLLSGGYKEFYQSHKKYCIPQSYKPMLHKDHSSELRFFRSKSKSWSAGDKRRYYGLGHGGYEVTMWMEKESF